MRGRCQPPSALFSADGDMGGRDAFLCCPVRGETLRFFAENRDMNNARKLFDQWASLMRPEWVSTFAVENGAHGCMQLWPESDSE